MKLKGYILSSLLIMLVFNSCQKDINTFKPDHNQFDSTWFEQIPQGAAVDLLMKDLAPEVYTDSIEINDSATEAHLSSNLFCTFEPGSLIDSSNNSITGKIEVNSVRLFKKGDFIRCGKSTKTDTTLIDCSSLSWLSFTQNNKHLKLNGLTTINVDYKLPYASSLKIFYEGANDSWVKNFSATNKILPIDYGYRLKTNSLTWTCIGNFLDSNPYPTTTLKINLPSNYTNANSIAYFILKNKNTAVRLLQDVSNRRFYHPNIPLNQEGVVLVISRQVDDYYLGFTILKPMEPNEALLKIKPVKKSLGDIIHFLDDL